MNKTFETIGDRVKAILIVSESSRNSDASLVANYWYKWDNNVIVNVGDPKKIPIDKQGALKIDEVITVNPALFLHEYHKVTQPSIIERARRLIQFEIYKMPDATDAEQAIKLDMMKLYYPTDPKVIKRRRLSSKLWKDYINTRQINNLIGEQGNVSTIQ